MTGDAGAVLPRGTVVDPATGDVEADPAGLDIVQVVFTQLHTDLDGPLSLLDGQPSRISGVVVAPFPRLLVRRIGGIAAGDMRWQVMQEARLTAYDDPEGSHGDDILRRIVAAAFRSLRTLQRRREPVAGLVATRVEFSADNGPTSETGRSGAVWSGTVRMWLHPAA